MGIRLTLPGIAYLSVALAAATGILYATIRIYTDGGKGLPDTFSASVTNTAATMGIAAFIGAIDMFFKFEETKERAEERRQWEARFDRFVEEIRAEREEARAERQEARAQREEARAQREQNQQAFGAVLEQNRAIIEQNQALTDRLINILERRNGNGSGNAS